MQLARDGGRLPLGHSKVQGGDAFRNLRAAKIAPAIPGPGFATNLGRQGRPKYEPGFGGSSRTIQTQPLSNPPRDTFSVFKRPF